MQESSLTSEELRSKLVKYAANILSRRPYFKHQLKQKLYLYQEKLGAIHDSNVVEEIVRDLAKSGYLDDEYLANAFVRRQLQKCYGPKIIRYKLKNLGVSTSQIDESLAEEATSEVLASTKEKIRIKYRSKSPQELSQKLYQRGF